MHAKKLHFCFATLFALLLLFSAAPLRAEGGFNQMPQGIGGGSPYPGGMGGMGMGMGMGGMGMGMGGMGMGMGMGGGGSSGNTSYEKHSKSEDINDAGKGFQDNLKEMGEKSTEAISQESQSFTSALPQLTKPSEESNDILQELGKQVADKNTANATDNTNDTTDQILANIKTNSDTNTKMIQQVMKGMEPTQPLATPAAAAPAPTIASQLRALNLTNSGAVRGNALDNAALATSPSAQIPNASADGGTNGSGSIGGGSVVGPHGGEFRAMTNSSRDPQAPASFPKAYSTSSSSRSPASVR